ncbi:hypothetical protein RI138_20925 [Streptomyces sp. C11-1]|uniref:Uncharacterized protein n=1 Tax=Streptomyces durocortorensis TaxID=2811104 RepID=A0ABY9VYW7_9ACTN|nr:hypothetical protein [Streptomyces durocortorensis]WNF29089.1 hypothetical protein RI138_20925 [Streptomyces durocortorensis]
MPAHCDTTAGRLARAYKNKTPHKRGTSFTVPDVVGIEMKLSVDRLLDGDED